MDVADISFGNYAVSPRGIHGILAGETLILVDGRQIFDSFYGGTWWGTWPFQLEDIQRMFPRSGEWTLNDAWYLQLRERMARAIVGLRANASSPESRR